MGEMFASSGALFFQYVKRDWRTIALWVVGLAAFSGGFVPFFEEIGKDQGLIAMYTTMSSPAMVAMMGTTPIESADAYTVGAMYSHMMLLMCALVAMIIAALHTVSHTRKEEEEGLSEFVAAYGAGRHAASCAVLLENLFINALLAVATALLMAAFNVESMPVSDCFLFGASLGAAGMMGAGIALVVAQIMPTSAGARGLSLALIGLMYIVRAATDMEDADLSMFVPLGWTYMAYPFAETSLLPLGLVCIMVAACAVAACALEHVRDFGAGLLREREGKGRVNPLLPSVAGLLFRLNRGIIVSWIAAFAVLGAAYGSIYGDMQSFLDSSELIEAVFTMEGISIEESFTAAIEVVLMGMVAFLPIAMVNKLFAEEASGRFDQFYAVKISRAQVYWTTVVLALLAACAGVLAGAASLGATALFVMPECSMGMEDFIAAGMVYAPATLAAFAIAAVLVGWVPRWRKFAYAYVAFSFMVNYFLGIVDLPEWLQAISLYAWVPGLPIDEFDPALFCGMAALGVALLVVGAVGYTRRDLQCGE